VSFYFVFVLFCFCFFCCFRSRRLNLDQEVGKSLKEAESYLATRSEPKDAKDPFFTREEQLMVEFGKEKEALLGHIETMEGLVKTAAFSPVLSEAVYAQLGALAVLQSEKEASKKVEKLIGLYTTLETRQGAARLQTAQKQEQLVGVAKAVQKKNIALEQTVDYWKYRALKAEAALEKEKEEEEALRRVVDETMTVVDSIIDKSGKLATFEQSYYSDSSFARDSF
jgi:hypothetical protein